MEILIRISLRNLLRQKRRNLLLGAAIGIGMAMLVIANSFSAGISDVLFNRILSYMSGHVTVAFTQNGNATRPYFRDGGRIQDIVEKAIPDRVSAEEGIGLFARAIGNGRTDNVILVGMNTKAEGTAKQKANLKSDFRMVEGNYDDILREDLENPILIASTKAEYLNVKVNDLIRVRFQDIHGRNQALRLTVAGIFIPANVFMSAPVFMDRKRLKLLAGYGPSDIGQIHINLLDPKKDAVKEADHLHSLLQPSIAFAYGSIARDSLPIKSLVTTVLGFKVDTVSLKSLQKLLSKNLSLRKNTLSESLENEIPEKGIPTKVISNKDILVGKFLADSLGIKIGDKISFHYLAKHNADTIAVPFKVTGIFGGVEGLSDHTLLINDKDFYTFFYENWPKGPDTLSTTLAPFIPKSEGNISPILCKEWNLLDRTRTTDEMQKKYRALIRGKSRATAIDVQTMYENASTIIKLEYALNLITLIAVLVLFFIIQVGVVNTLRMTIRERTREIGTIRAIGMQKSEVRNIFMLETFFLSFFASLAGIVLAFIGMGSLTLLTFSLEGNPLSMLLVDGHLHFQPSVWAILFYMALILCMAAITAWFPSQKAAKVSPAEALRHYG